MSPGDADVGIGVLDNHLVRVHGTGCRGKQRGRRQVERGRLPESLQPAEACLVRACIPKTSVFMGTEPSWARPTCHRGEPRCELTNSEGQSLQLPPPKYSSPAPGMELEMGLGRLGDTAGLAQEGQGLSQLPRVQIRTHRQDSPAGAVVAVCPPSPPRACERSLAAPFSLLGRGGALGWSSKMGLPRSLEAPATGAQQPAHPSSSDRCGQGLGSEGHRQPGVTQAGCIQGMLCTLMAHQGRPGVMAPDRKWISPQILGPAGGLGSPTLVCIHQCPYWGRVLPCLHQLLGDFPLF